MSYKQYYHYILLLKKKYYRWLLNEKKKHYDVIHIRVCTYIIGMHLGTLYIMYS